MTNPWAFNPSVPLDIKHEFDVVPGVTITPEVKTSISPVEASLPEVESALEHPSSATVTLGIRF